MEKAELVAASAEEGSSVVKQSAQVQEKEEVVTATEVEAVPMEEQLSIVAEGDGKRTQECIFEPETALAVEEEEPVGSIMGVPTEDPATVASEAPGDPMLKMSREISEMVEEVMGEAASVEGKEALKAEVSANVEESLVEAAELTPTQEIVEEFSVEAEPAPKVEIVEEEAVAPGQEAVAKPETAPTVEEQEFCFHAVFLSHSGEQKGFVRRLSVALQECFLHSFFDLFKDSLPLAENFAVKIFDAIKECHVGVVVLSEKFFTSKWPMMELVAMVDRAKQTEGLFKILPVFYSISTQDIDKNRSGWMSVWNELAKAKPEGVDIEKWNDAVDYIRPINGLKYDGKDDLKLENEIVDKLCDLTPPEIRLDDSHMQGRDRLCKVIQDQIVDLQKGIQNGVCMVGLYGMHGSGKTSICKALCNKYSVKFRRRVCHVELGSGSEEDLMREVVKKLAGTSRERLKEFNHDQLRMMLKKGIVKDAVFLAVDNMMNTDASIAQARHYLSARLPPGSIVMVTAHSKDSLMELREFRHERSCLKMPELMEEEAKSLFVKSCCWNEVDGELVNRCIKLCNFAQGDDSGGCHYHPLALHVLGKQLQCIDPKKWGAQLDKIDEDIFNPRDPRDPDSHLIFSILRRSFDTLTEDDQLLYMDVVLFIPGRLDPKDELDWLSMVHSIPEIDSVPNRLRRLKTKSLLESLGDGMRTGIRMHELWRKFCVAETKRGKKKHRRWVYEVEKQSALVDTSPSSTCWGDVKRVAFLDPDMRSLEGVNFAYFPSVTVLKITGMKPTKKVALDLSALTRLKSLEITGSDLERLVLLGLPRGLHFLCLISDCDFWASVLMDEIDNSWKFETETGIKDNYKHWGSTSRSPLLPLIKQMGRLKDLKFLILGGLASGTLPDMSNMILLRAVGFCGLKNAVTVSGLSSKMTNLRELEILWCRKLRSCPGVGGLVNLEILRCKGCCRLKRLPNLQKLRKLRILDIRGCPLITELPGLGDLEALEKLYAGCEVMLSADDDASYSIKLPDLRKLSKLRVLRLCDCHVMAVSGFENLISLQKIEANFPCLLVKPSLRHLTKLQDVNIDGWDSKGLKGLNDLVLLRFLRIGSCEGVDKLPGLQNLENLEVLRVIFSEFTDFSSLSNLSPLALKELFFGCCFNFKSVPDLQRLTRLEDLDIRYCPIESLTLDGVQLPQLRTLRLVDCESLKRLTTHKSMNTLSTLKVRRCTGLTTVPDLCNEYFPALEELSLKGCNKLTTLSSSGTLTALQVLDLTNCSGVRELPDLGLFPALESLSLEGCGKLTTLSSSVPLLGLEVLDVRGCRSLSRDDIDRIQASCPQCTIVYDAGVAKTRKWKAAGLFQGAPGDRMIRALGLGFCFSMILAVIVKQKTQ